MGQFTFPWRSRRAALRVPVSTVASILALFIGVASRALAGPCDAPVNPIVCENSKTGNPSSEWDVSGAGDASIQGFATDISVDQGETVHFKVDTPSTDYRLDIYRLGFYGGLGARKVATIQPSGALPQSQPNCLNDATTGLNDCGNWSESASWAVPADAVSGIYFAKLVREDAASGGSHVIFIVRDDDGHSPILFQTSDTTWQAYNRYGGNSLYAGSPAGRAYKVSYNRPFTTRGTSDEDWLFNSEYPMVRWLEANGYNVSYFTGVDADRRGGEILEHQIYMPVGHDEYWSSGQRANVEAARAAGKNLAFFSGNEIFWKTRWEPSIDGTGTSHRTLVCYKETHANAVIDPQDPPTWTGTWRDPRFSPPGDGGRPENALSGTIFTVNSGTTAMQVPAADGKMRFWRNTSVATLSPGQTATLAGETVGYEWDEDLDNGFRPPGLFHLSTTVVNNVERIQDYGSTYGPGTATHTLTLYRSGNALVFGAGTVQWPWGLDSNHDRGSGATDVRMQQATVNLFADMGVQPDTLQPGLTTAAASSDNTPPSSQIISPASGATVSSGSPVTITGSAADSGGEVGGVEVSTDGGTTWHRAVGRASWSYVWTPVVTGSAVIQSRAVDDSGNLETPGAGVSVTVGERTCPCTIWNDSFIPGNPSANDGQPIETGVKFRSDAAGFITGIRFYKGTGNTGTHTAHFWTSAGALLGTATFTGETASGWQQANFSSPIAISANTTYVASYFSAGGGYAYDDGYFASEFANPPLRALADGVDGPNGVYNFGSTGFPTTTFEKANYWVDVVFATSAEPDTAPPTVVSVTPVAGANGVSATANVVATFNEAMNPATITSTTFTLKDSSNSPVASAITYNAATLQATLDPTNSLAFSTGYTATVKGGAGGVEDAAGNPLSTDFTWSFTTAGPPPPPPDQGPGGPILVVTGGPFGTYYAEILRAEGLNAFLTKDLSTVTAATLGAYDVVLLANLALTNAQATMFSDWVTSGGNLIAMRPDPALASLLGLTVAGGSLSNGYFQVNTGSAPGAGIVGQTIQFHGTADRYTLNGATSIATLYSNASTATPNPAVTVNAVGSNGGQAAAFTFDLAQSVVYTRQGNPAWAGDSRDGEAGPIRSDNLFFGAKPGDVQPDWVDFSKIAIPQADEAQRLLANLIGLVNLDKKPLPRFWYFPRGEKAVVIMTGDDHGSGNTAPRFDQYIAASPPGCSLADWECIRASSYVYTNVPISNSQAASYDSQGFEIGLHVNTGCANFTPASLESNFADQLAAFGSKYGSLPAIVTNRTHCIAWSDWASEPKVELAHGIRLDTNYYYWPDTWVDDRPGMFTGSGIPMRFADLDGTLIDVYQAATQITDESGQSYSLHINALLDKAIGPEGYYGAFTANMHTDFADHAGSNAIVASAQSHGVPVVSAKQMLTWLDGRNSSSFGSFGWSGNTLSFSIAVGSGANGLRAMVPTQSSVGALTGITRNGSGVSFTRETIKGVEYAFIPAAAGAYTAQYAVDSTPPVISSVSATPGSGGTATVTWTTDEPATSRVDYGTASGSLGSNVSDSALVTAHTINLTGLATNTTYYYRVTSTDAASNSATSPNPPTAPASFATPSAAFIDTTAADFSAGTTGASTAVSRSADGEVVLTAALREEFSGSSLPSGWAAAPWQAGGTTTVSNDVLTVNGARAVTDGSFTPGRSLEFVATFGAANFQHVGFAADFDSNTPWAFFSTFNTSGTLYARTHNGTTPADHAIPGNWIGSPHRYRIEWNASSVLFYIDGNLVDTQSVSIGNSLRVLAGEFSPGGAALTVDWIRMSPFAASGSFDSRIFDAGQSVGWGTLSWTQTVPAGTGIALSVRTGNTASPDASWTSFAPVANGSVVGTSSRFIQYRAALTTSNALSTPSLESVSIGYGGAVADTTPPTIVNRSPAADASDVAVASDVTVQFSEAMDGSTISGSTVRLRANGAGSDVAASVSYAGATATLDPSADLEANKTYQVTVSGSVTDVAGNPLGSDAVWSFNTPVAVGGTVTTLTDTTVADFSGGATGTSTAVSQIADGEVILAPAVNEEFGGTALPASGGRRRLGRRRGGDTVGRRTPDGQWRLRDHECRVRSGPFPRVRRHLRGGELPARRFRRGLGLGSALDHLRH